MESRAGAVGYLGYGPTGRFGGNAKACWVTFRDGRRYYGAKHCLTLRVLGATQYGWFIVAPPPKAVTSTRFPASCCSVAIFTPPPRFSSRLMFLPPKNNPALSKAPFVGREHYADMSYDQMHELCNRRGYNRKDSKEVLKTQVGSMGAEERKRTFTGDNPMDTSVTVTRKRGRATEDVVGKSDASLGSQEKRCRVGDLRLAFVTEKEAAGEHAL